MSNHILHVHLTASASSSIPDLQHQLCLKMKDDEQARDADLAIWLSLRIKFEKHVPLVEPCRVDAIRTRDHEDHHDDDACPEGESSAKRQKTYEHETYTSNDDEIPSEEVSPQLLAEVSRKGLIADDLGMESYQHKVNLTAPTLTFPGTKEEKLLTITSNPIIGLIYENNKKEKRTQNLNKDDAEHVMFYEEYIQERLRHRDQMRH
ncbi:hypothetical protein Tco_1182678 [Tanacetum coccineum]